MQHTLANDLKITGTGLHSGCPVCLTLKPAPVNHGIIFKRVDLPGQPEIKALYSNVVDTRNCTCIGDKAGNLVSTIEHLMASLYMTGIDNALIEVDNQELPIMDGSGKCFFDALKGRPLLEQPANRKILQIKKTITFTDEKGNSVKIEPSDKLYIHFEIDFPSKIVGHQEFDGEVNKEVFASKIACCRTFCEKYQVDYLRSIGLIKGGSLENAVVLDGETVLNEGGFRLPQECVNHKVLDAIGDLYTSGFVVLGKLSAIRTGHFHTNELLRIIFSDRSNYEIKD